MLSQDLLDRAIANDIDAIYQVACCYGSGTDVEQDDETAFQWFMKGAGLGDLRAKQKVGWAYYSGSGVEQDYRQALQWLSEPAEQGDVLAQDLLGWIYQSGGDGVEKNEKAAFEWFRKAADNGYANSCRMVASAYEEGSGTEKSLEQAFYYYLKGAEDGDDGCQCEAGRMYLNGEGVAKNDSEAERLLRASAAQGYAQAMNYLCHMFLGASGHAVDLEMFNQYYEQLKKTREEVADWEKEFIDKWLRDLSSKKNNVQLQTLADKANHGDTNAMVSLGMFHMELFGNENLDASQRFEALDQATERFRAAVKAGNTAACMLLVSAISIHATIMDEDYGTEELNKMWLEAYETFQKYREGKPNEQLTDYELSQYQQILMGLCRTALRQNDSSAAEKWAKAAVEAHAEDAELYLGAAYEKQGRHEEAIELLETIESGHMPQFALRDLFDVMYAQAMALAGTSQYERAVKLAEMGQSIEWGHEEATNLFADFEETVRRLAAEHEGVKRQREGSQTHERNKVSRAKGKKHGRTVLIGILAVVLACSAISSVLKSCGRQLPQTEVGAEEAAPQETKEAAPQETQELTQGTSNEQASGLELVDAQGLCDVYLSRVYGEDDSFSDLFWRAMWYYAVFYSGYEGEENLIWVDDESLSTPVSYRGLPESEIISAAYALFEEFDGTIPEIPESSSTFYSEGYYYFDCFGVGGDIEYHVVSMTENSDGTIDVYGVEGYPGIYEIGNWCVHLSPNPHVDESARVPHYYRIMSAEYTPIAQN